MSTPLEKLHALYELSKSNQESFERATRLGLTAVAAKLRNAQVSITTALADHVKAEMSPTAEVAS